MPSHYTGIIPKNRHVIPRSRGCVMYEKKLKRSKDGFFIRYIGRNVKGTPEKFRLGYDPLQAEEKVRLIGALWREIENFRGERSFWDRENLEAAKAIAKGMPPELPKRDFEDPIN